MAETQETIIGTVLYAASVKSYEVYNVIFTSERVIPVGFGWRKNSSMADLANLGVNLMSFPFMGPRVNTDPILMHRWFEIKFQNRGKPWVSYTKEDYDNIIGMGVRGRTEHKISSMPYNRIKRVVVTDNALTNDYRVQVDAGFSAAPAFLIPTESLQEFRELLARTPLAQKLDLKVVVPG